MSVVRWFMLSLQRKKKTGVDTYYNLHTYKTYIWLKVRHIIYFGSYGYKLLLNCNMALGLGTNKWSWLDSDNARKRTLQILGTIRAFKILIFNQTPYENKSLFILPKTMNPVGLFIDRSPFTVRYVFNFAFCTTVDQIITSYILIA